MHHHRDPETGRHHRRLMLGLLMLAMLAVGCGAEEAGSGLDPEPATAETETEAVSTTSEHSTGGAHEETGSLRFQFQLNDGLGSQWATSPECYRYAAWTDEPLTRGEFQQDAALLGVSLGAVEAAIASDDHRGLQSAFDDVREDFRWTWITLAELEDACSASPGVVDGYAEATASLSAWFSENYDQCLGLGLSCLDGYWDYASPYAALCRASYLHSEQWDWECNRPSWFPPYPASWTGDSASTTTLSQADAKIQAGDTNAGRADCENRGPEYQWQEEFESVWISAADGYEVRMRDGYEVRMTGRYECVKAIFHREATTAQACAAAGPEWGWHHAGRFTVDGVSREVWQCQRITYIECLTEDGHVSVASNEVIEGWVAC